MIQRAELYELVRLNTLRFKDDPRYCLSTVSDGFACRRGREDDTALLNRICTAYIKAAARQRFAPRTFGPTKWWQQISGKKLRQVTHALATRDIDALQLMYRNFFRDPCSTGLVGLPVDMQQCYFSGEIPAFYKHFFLGDALHRIDLWKAWTGGEYPLHVLAAPDTGNPYGVLIDGVFIRIAAEYQHFYAQEIARLLDPKRSGVVLEIGGGFGGMAYYLIRDNPGVTYLNFDTPETTALASYYLLKSFPNLTAALYGEAELTPELLNNSDIILMPSFELPQLCDASVDVSFSSHVLADLSAQAVCEYIDQLARITRDHILLLDRSDTRPSVSRRLCRKSGRFNLVRKCATFWDSARALRTDQTECLYSACPTILSMKPARQAATDKIFEF